MKCNKCGTELDDDAIFCGECGSRVVRKSIVRFCRNCGREIPEDSKFCSFCGQLVSIEGLTINSIDDGENALGVNSYEYAESNDSVHNDLEIKKTTNVMESVLVADKNNIETPITEEYGDADHSNNRNNELNNSKGSGLFFNTRTNMFSSDEANGFKNIIKVLWNKLNLFEKISVVSGMLVLCFLLFALLEQNNIALFISIIQVAGIAIAFLIHKEIIRAQYEWLKYVVIGFVLILTIPTIKSYKTKNTSTPTIDTTTQSLEEYSYDDEINEYIEEQATEDPVIMINEVPTGFLNHYEEAEFAKFNSPASENGLGDTPVWVSGKYENVEVLETDTYKYYYAMLSDPEGNQWVVLLDTEEFGTKKPYQALEKHQLVIKGVYVGFSDVYQMPVINAIGIFDRETGDTIISVSNSIVYADMINSFESDSEVSSSEQPEIESTQQSDEEWFVEYTSGIQEYYPLLAKDRLIVEIDGHNIILTTWADGLTKEGLDNYGSFIMIMLWKNYRNRCIDLSLSGYTKLQEHGFKDASFTVKTVDYDYHNITLLTVINGEIEYDYYSIYD